MTILFRVRERAVEGIFVHDEETRFVARRRGMEALATWAGESMELDAGGRAAYTQRVLDAFVSGTPEEQLIAAVQTDIERAGKPTLAWQAVEIHAQALAETTLEMRGRPASQPGPSPLDTNPRDAFEREHPKPGHHGWSL